MKINLNFKQNRGVFFLCGLLLGIVSILVIRFITYNPHPIHYHANFAVYINGQRETFDSPQYYQEVTACVLTNAITLPTQRAHMHDNINSVVHVHDHAVTWGQFFENLGWYVGPNYIENQNGTLYEENADNKLHVVLDSQDYTDVSPITNMVIKDRSRLLISFGNIDNTTLSAEFKTVPMTAAYYDTHRDPSSCSGSETITLSDRLHHLF